MDDAQGRELPITAEGVRRLEQELAELRGAGRQEIAQRLAAARESGSELTENSEYLDTIAEQERLEQRIALLEERLRNGRLINENEQPPGVVALGRQVRLRDVQGKESLEFQLVGPAEANPDQQRLSSESPVGKALLGRRKGETVQATTPTGQRQFKILDVRPANRAVPAKKTAGQRKRQT